MTVWFGQFRSPGTVLGDNAFNQEEFISFIKASGPELKPFPPRLNSKNVLESNHYIIRSICCRLKHKKRSASVALRAQHDVIFSNDLYGSNTLSEYGMEKGFTLPISTTAIAISNEFSDAQQRLATKRKLALMISS